MDDNILSNLFNIPQPEYLGGLLGAEAADKLRERANTTGLINMAVGYLAQPKNQRLGLGRILANSYMAGQQGAQGVYTGALEDWQTAQKVKEMQRQQQQQVLQDQAIGKIAETNPELGTALRAFPSAAPAVLEKLYSPQKAESPLGKLDPKDFTPESWNNFVNAGATLQATQLLRSAPKEGTTPELQRYIDIRDSLPPNDPRRATYQAMIDKLTTHAPAPSATVINQGESEWSKKFGGALGESDAQLVQVARSAPEAVATSRRIKTLLNQNPITGTGASALLPLSTALATAGITEDNTAATTQALVSELANVTLSNVKGSGLGAGQGFTDKDLQFLQDAKSGRIDWTAANIKRVADLNERSALKSIGKYDELRNRLDPQQRTFFGLVPITIQGTRPTPVIRKGNQ